MRFHLLERELTFTRPLLSAKGRYSTRRSLLVQIDHGPHYGLGEGAPLPGFSRETFEACERALRQVAERLEGQDAPRTLEEIEALCSRLGALKSAPSARFALEGALLDLLARAEQRSVASLLDRACQPELEANATLGAEPAPQAFASARARREQGFSCFKLKVGVHALELELAAVRATREAIGEEATLRLDANGAWQIDEAIEAIEAMSRYGIALVEQPVAARDIKGLRAVREAVAPLGVAIAADEAIDGLESLQEVLSAGAADVVVLKPMRLGGALITLEAMRRAEAAGAPVILTTLLEGAIGRALTCHVASAGARHLAGPCGLATAELLKDEPIGDPGQWRGERYTLGDEPGLGIAPLRPCTPSTSRREERPMALLNARALSHRDRTALATPSRALTYGELHDEVARRATWLARRGVQRGSRVALCAETRLESALWAHALMAHGACTALLHPRQTPKELELAAARLKPALILSDEPIASGCEREALTRASSEAAELPERAPGELLGHRMEERALMLFTSGTTGVPKLVALSWSNLVHSALGSSVRLGHLPSDRWLLSLPLCHIGGFSILSRCLLLGTAAVIHERFEPEQVAEAIASGEVTIWSAVSAMAWRVVEVMRERDHRAHAAFRVLLLGGGAVPASLITACEALGMAVATTYGMTETASQLTTRAPWMAGRDAGSAGPPLIFNEVALDPHTEELLARGDTLFEGYLDGSLEVSAESRSASGWFSTGDLARIDASGHVTPLDRRSDRIVTGGENVSPARVERALCQRRGVREACVVGLSDERWGQRVEAVIVLEDFEKKDDFKIDALLSELAQRLAAFELPRRLHLWEALPRTSLGKVRRDAVRRALQQDRAPQEGLARSEER